MKKLLIIILVLIAEFGYSQGPANTDTTKFFKSFDYGWNWRRAKFREALILPTDTTYNKLGIAALNGTLYLGNGIKWAATGGSGGGGDVASVFGRTGAVVALAADYNAFYPLLSGTYNNPSWLNQLAWSKITGAPSFITNIPTDSSLSINNRINLKLNISDTTGKWIGIGWLATLAAKQDALVSGTNIKTVNGNSLLGSGDLTISGGVPYTLINGGANIGTGSEVFKDTSSNKLNFRRLNAGTGISVTQNTNDITIAATNIDSSAARVRTGTYSQRVAIVSPVIGDIFTQTDRLKGLYFYDGDRWDFQGTPLQYLYFNQFNGSQTYNAGYNTTIGAATSGAGSGVSIQSLTGIDGVAQFVTGTTSGGYANTNFLGATGTTNIVFDSLIVYTEYKIQIPTLSDATDRFQIAVGATTSTSSYNFPAFVFYYSDNNNSGQWSTITRAHNSGSLTIKNTSVAVTAGTWVKLAIEVDSYANEIKFYINDVLVQTHTSSDNTPLNGAVTWGNSGYGHAGIIKTAGTTSRTLLVDYVSAYVTKQKY